MLCRHLKINIRDFRLAVFLQISSSPKARNLSHPRLLALFSCSLITESGPGSPETFLEVTPAPLPHQSRTAKDATPGSKGKAAAPRGSLSDRKARGHWWVRHPRWGPRCGRGGPELHCTCHTRLPHEGTLCSAHRNRSNERPGTKAKTSPPPSRVYRAENTRSNVPTHDHLQS